MDTSKVYQEMCKCPEIQSEWKPQEGDFFSFCGELKIIKDYEIWALEKRELSHIKEWNEIIKTMGGHFVDHFLEARECFVFLPRQDQIQEMMPKCNCQTCLIYGLYNFFEKNIEGFFDKKIYSMEQIWLCFYMSKAHQKIWNGKEWIKNGR